MGKVQDIVVADVISRIEANGDLFWERPWNAVGLMPMNLKSGNGYSGVNVFILGLSPFESPYWVTSNQALALGGVKREGEEPRLIIFFKPKDRNDPESYRFMRFYEVFNTDQFDGIEHARLDELKETLLTRSHIPPAGERVERAEALLESYAKRGAEVVHGTDLGPCYVPLKDKIFMPLQKQFKTTVKYFKTLFHEHAHGTGHRTRLDREGVTNHARFGDHTYSTEELIAEMTAAMLCHHVGMYDDEVADHSAAYLQSWIKRLKAEPQILFTAGAAAQKAYDYILGVQKKKPAKA